MIEGIVLTLLINVNDIITYNKIYNIHDFVFYKEKDYDRIKAKGFYFTEEKGLPEIPYEIISFVLPHGKDIRRIEVKKLKTRVLKNKYIIYPAQSFKPLTLNSKYKFSDFIYPSSEVYGKDEYFPKQVIEISHIGNFNGIKIVDVAIYPFQYNPYKKEIRFVEEIEFEIVLKGSSNIPPSIYISKSKYKILKNFLEKRVINIEHIREALSHFVLIDEDMRYSSGFSEFVIITEQELIPAFEPLKDWYNEKGIKTDIISVEKIYSEYDGVWDFRNICFSYEYIGDNAAKIKEFILDRYLYTGLSYVLLVGDDEIGFPFRYAHAYKNYDEYIYIIPSDLYFEDLTGFWEVDNDGRIGEPGDDAPDYYPEVFVGRVVCDSFENAYNFVYKILNYQKNPGNPPEFFKKIYWLYQDNFDNDWEEKVDSGISIINSLYPGFEHYKIENIISNKYNKGILDSLSRGYGMIFSITHGWIDRFKLSNDYYGTNLFLSALEGADYPSADELYNSDRYFFWYSISCDPAAFESEDIAGRVSMVEGLLSKYRDGDKPIGVVGFTGNTRLSWLDGASDLMYKFLNFLFSDSMEYRYGVSKSLSKSLTNSWYLRYSTNFFGIPEMQIYTEIPEEIELSMPSEIPSGIPVDLVIEAKNKRTEEPLEGVKIVILRGSFSVIAKTNFEGKACFNKFYYPEEGYLTVTAVKHNYLPSQGFINVVSGLHVGDDKYITRRKRLKIGFKVYDLSGRVKNAFTGKRKGVYFIIKMQGRRIFNRSKIVYVN